MLFPVNASLSGDGLVRRGWQAPLRSTAFRETPLSAEKRARGEETQRGSTKRVREQSHQQGQHANKPAGERVNKQTKGNKLAAYHLIATQPRAQTRQQRTGPSSRTKPNTTKISQQSHTSNTLRPLTRGSGVFDQPHIRNKSLRSSHRSDAVQQKQSANTHFERQHFCQPLTRPFLHPTVPE